MEGHHENDLKTIGCECRQTFQASSCHPASCDDIDAILPSLTAEKPAINLGSKGVAQLYDAMLNWLLRKLIPGHLAKKPPPDRKITY